MRPPAREITFRVTGRPIPQGSKNVYNGRLVDANARALRAWRADIGEMARLMLVTNAPFEAHQPVLVRIVFAMIRPKTYPKRIVDHTRKPDLDKLVRAVFDALTVSGIIKDDAQIVGLQAAKAYVEPGQHPGALISIRGWDGD